jgi:hypothetical protein
MMVYGTILPENNEFFKFHCQLKRLLIIWKDADDPQKDAGSLMAGHQNFHLHNPFIRDYNRRRPIIKPEHLIPRPNACQV